MVPSAEGMGASGSPTPMVGMVDNKLLPPIYYDAFCQSSFGM